MNKLNRITNVEAWVKRGSTLFTRRLQVYSFTHPKSTLATAMSKQASCRVAASVACSAQTGAIHQSS